MKNFIVYFAVLIGLTTGFSTEKTPRGRALHNDFHEQLIGLQKEVNEAIARYKFRHLSFFADRLNLVLDSIHNYVEQLAEGHSPEWKFAFRHKLQVLAKQIHFDIGNPAPEESFKAGAIYLSAIISLKNETSASDLVQQIHKSVENIIFRENHFPGGDEEVMKMHQSLRDLLVNYTIPVLDSHEALEDKVEEKIQLLENDHWNEEMMKMYEKLEVYRKLALKMNEMIPLVDNENVDKWFEKALTHHTTTEEFEKFVSAKRFDFHSK